MMRESRVRFDAETVPLLVVLIAVAGCLGVGGYLASKEAKKPSLIPADTTFSSKDALQLLRQRGADIELADYGYVVVLESQQFSDDDLRILPHLEVVRSVTVIDADVTDDGLMELANLKDVQHVLLMNTQVTESGARRFRRATQSQRCVVKIVETSAGDSGE